MLRIIGLFFLSATLNSYASSTLDSPTHDSPTHDSPTHDSLETAAAKKPIEYSINLMWINKDLVPTQPFLFPEVSEEKVVNKYLNKILNWAKTTTAHSGGGVNVWYDSALTTPSSLANTQALISKLALDHRELALIQFKDVRIFPEVLENSDVFSQETPVYFRVDLLRAIMAYHSLIENEDSYFVYGDLDMTPLSGEELFDHKSLVKLNKFAILMARGGSHGFENGFQILSGKKPNLLKAMKAAVIDISILRAENILSGGFWAYKSRGDTRPLEQTVYDCYPNMFSYYYHLEGWGNLKRNPETHDIRIFGLQEYTTLSFSATAELVLSNKRKFNYDGKIKVRSKTKYPTKIVDMPPSHFGGGIATLDPDKITVKNFEAKLAYALESEALFDSNLFYLAARNNNLDAIGAIVAKLSPTDLFETFIKFSKYKGSAFHAAVEEGNLEVLVAIFSKLPTDPETLLNLSQTLMRPGNSYRKNSILGSNIKNLIKVIPFLMEQFKSEPHALYLSIAEALLHYSYSEEEYYGEERLDFFNLLVENFPTLCTFLTSEGNTLAYTAAKNGATKNDFRILKRIAEIAPESFKIKNKRGDFPLRIAAERADLETFYQIYRAAPEMLSEIDLSGNTIAHAAADKGSLEIIQLIAEKNPELFMHQNDQGYTPAIAAARSSRSFEVLKFIGEYFSSSFYLKDRDSWSIAAYAANRADTLRNFEYILSLDPGIILLDFRNVLERASYNNKDILVLLANKFSEKQSTILELAKYKKLTKTIEELELLMSDRI